MDQYAENQTRTVLCKTEVDIVVNTWNVKNGVKFDKNRNVYLKKRRFFFLIRANHREVFDIRSNQCMPQGGKLVPHFSDLHKSSVAFLPVGVHEVLYRLVHHSFTLGERPHQS